LSTSLATATPTPSSSNGLGTGAKAGIGVGVTLGALAIVALAAILLIRGKKRKVSGETPNNFAEQGVKEDAQWTTPAELEGDRRRSSPSELYGSYQ
jgi:hypothetical protein